MRSIKYFMFAVFTVVLATGLIACGGKKEKKQRAQYNAGENIEIVDGASYDGQGVIFKDLGKRQTQVQFQNGVNELLSDVLDGEELGEVSMEENDDTGIRFKGVLSLDSRLDVNRLQNSRRDLRLKEDFIVQIRDSKVNENDDYDGIHIKFGAGSLVDSSINGDRVSIYFGKSDSAIQMDFEGAIVDDFNKSQIVGRVYYNNTVTGESGQLGAFRIETCSLIENCSE